MNTQWQPRRKKRMETITGDWVIDICIQTHTNNIIIIIMSKLLDISWDTL